jgi:hypothetical protein
MVWRHGGGLGDALEGMHVSLGAARGEVGVWVREAQNPLIGRPLAAEVWGWGRRDARRAV